jgi:hypothetical protein
MFDSFITLCYSVFQMLPMYFRNSSTIAAFSQLLHDLSLTLFVAVVMGTVKVRPPFLPHTFEFRCSHRANDLLKTVCLSDEDPDVVSDHCKTSSMAPEPTATMSPLPSLLLSPRRTFLAALILASKFSQEKCYLNRAWAKLSGLPPREIGRC